MASTKVLMFSIFSALVIAGIRADEEAGAIIVDIPRSEKTDSALRLEIEQLKYKISSLESTTSEKARESESKDRKISQLESVIQEKGASVVSLRKRVELLKKKGAVDAEELVAKVHARSNELEKKVEELNNQIDIQKRKRNALEAQTIEAEKKVQELDLKLRGFEKMNSELKKKIQKTERALQVAEEKLARVQLAATSKLKELKEVHGAWFPPWLAYRLMRCQEISAANWNEHVRPALGVLVQKVVVKSYQAHKWVEPHLETAKAKWIPFLKARWISFTTTVRPHMEKASTKAFEIFSCQKWIPFLKARWISFTTTVRPFLKKWIPFLKARWISFTTTVRPHMEKAQDIVLEHLEKRDLTKPLATKEFVWFAKWISFLKARWISFTTTVRPHMEKASTKAFEIFEFCRTTAKPHTFALREFANPYVQEAKTFVKPYVELAATITKPYVDKASAVLKPYTGTVVYGYRKLLETTGTYHHQAQDIVLEHLEKRDLTKPLATKEFVWFAASASLALPVFLIYKMLSKFSGKKVVKPVRGVRSHRRHKRRHADQ